MICLFFFRVVGFDELGNTDNFPTEVLERRIATSGEKGDKNSTRPLVITSEI